MNPEVSVEDKIAELTQKINDDKAKLKALKKQISFIPGVDDKVVEYIWKYYQARKHLVDELEDKEFVQKNILDEVHYLQTHSHIVNQFVKAGAVTPISIKIQEELEKLVGIQAEIRELKEQLGHPVNFTFQGWFEVKDWNCLLKKHVFGKRFFGFHYRNEDQDDLEESIKLLRRPCQHFRVDADTMFVYGKTEEGGAFEFVLRLPLM